MTQTKASVWYIGESAVRDLWLASDPFGIYRQRKLLALAVAGTPVWRGCEWWMGQ